MSNQTKTSYGRNLLDSLKGIGSGLLLFVVVTFVLWWNEGNYVTNDKIIKEVNENVIANVDISSVNPSLNGQLVHAVGRAESQDILMDNDFGINEKAIFIGRKVEYLQYVERSKKEDDRTTYSYSLEWVSEPIPSGNFNDSSYRGKNTVRQDVSSRTEYARNVTFGAYRLPDSIIRRIKGEEPANPVISAIPNTRHVSGNVVYYGSSFNSQQVGDVRVTFTKIPSSEISIIAKIQNNSFEEYYTKKKKTFDWVASGNQSVEKILNNAIAQNKANTWMFRFVGIFILIAGLKMIFKFLPALFRFFPFLAKIIGAGVNIFSTVFGVAWSLLVISLAWIFYRPLIGVPLLLISIAGIWFLRKKAKENEAKNPAPQPQVQQPVAPQQQTQPQVNVAPTSGWTCSCGTVNSAKFCSNCGNPEPKPVVEGQWTCSCGTVNTAKFCSNCGNPSPNTEVRCPNCNWLRPPNQANVQFCGECGKPLK